MKQTNINNNRDDGSQLGVAFRLFVTGLGAYLAIVLTSISILLLLVTIMIDDQSIDKYQLAIYQVIPVALLVLYSVFTTKTKNSSIGYRFGQIIKRFLDVVFSSLYFFFCLPLFLLIALAIKIESPGPILFLSKRVGQYGRLFDIYKFRTMNIDPTEITPTRIGRLLRRTSLDETPMLYNVLVGEISLVGPRPRHPDYLEETLDTENRILTARPGITGLWQTSATPPYKIKDAVMYDLEYLENWSLILDMRIFFKTIIVVLTHNDR